MVAIRLDGVTVERQGATLLDRVDLEIDHAEVVAVLGVTGSGKTSLLRAIAGLDDVTEGAVWFDDRDVTAYLPQDRNLAFVFEASALMPNRTVGRNIALPLEIRRATAEEIEDRVGAEARALHIGELLEADPSTLSDGTQRVVEIARALVKQPAVLLLDEPFRGIDGHLAAVVRKELRLLQRAFEVTVVIVVHDAHEARVLADRVAVIGDRRIAQTGRFADVYREPATAEIAMLTGDANVFGGRVVAGPNDDAFVECGSIRLHSWRPDVRALVGREVEVVTRPEWWHVDPNGSIEATVERLPILGARHMTCIVDDRWVMVAAPDTEVVAGQTVSLRVSNWVI